MREEVGTMNTERHAWWSNRVVELAERRTPPVCGCGQDLDACTRTHCPRCGTSLTRHAA
jgi:predicted amidophosphoribosyltransferase